MTLKQLTKNLLASAVFSAVLLVGCSSSLNGDNADNDIDIVVSESDDINVAAFEPGDIAARAYEHFVELSKIPRVSGNMQGISDYLADFASNLGLEVTRDSALNVFIKKPGSPGRENEPAIILKAHMDMVGEKNSNVDHDFATDPIIPIIENDWITSSKKTTLGADNGGGLAVLLTVLETDNLSHPPIEAIITTDEETGMTGAAMFDITLLSGTRLINIDEEIDDTFTVSCAGGADVEILVSVDEIPIPNGFEAYELTVEGLTGGHSGVDIHLGLANANILIARLLQQLDEDEVEFYLTAINGGSARNAIPRECVAVVLFDPKYLESVAKIVENAETLFKSEFSSDPDLSVTLTQTQAPDTVLSTESALQVILTIFSVPNGVIAMSADIEGLVQTSNNLGVIETVGDTVIMSTFVRSSLSDDLTKTLDDLRTLSDADDREVTISNEVPPWAYKEDSPLRDSMVATYTDMHGREPNIAAIHAGLECAMFAGKMPDVDLISIGPNIQGGHSPDERMSLSSFNSFCEFLVRVLGDI